MRLDHSGGGAGRATASGTTARITLGVIEGHLSARWYVLIAVAEKGASPEPSSPPLRSLRPITGEALSVDVITYEVAALCHFNRILNIARDVMRARSEWLTTPTVEPRRACASPPRRAKKPRHKFERYTMHLEPVASFGRCDLPEPRVLFRLVAQPRSRLRLIAILEAIPPIAPRLLAARTHSSCCELAARCISPHIGCRAPCLIRPFGIDRMAEFAVIARNARPGTPLLTLKRERRISDPSARNRRDIEKGEGSPESGFEWLGHSGSSAQPLAGRAGYRARRRCNVA